VFDLLLSAVALMLVFEGLLPFLSPSAWRELIRKASQLGDGQIRFLGITSMLIGVGLLVWLR